MKVCPSRCSCWCTSRTWLVWLQVQCYRSARVFCVTAITHFCESGFSLDAQKHRALWTWKRWLKKWLCSHSNLKPSKTQQKQSSERPRHSLQFCMCHVFVSCAPQKLNAVTIWDLTLLCVTRTWRWGRKQVKASVSALYRFHYFEKTSFCSKISVKQLHSTINNKLLMLSAN